METRSTRSEIPAEHDREELDEAGVESAAEDGRSARFTCLDDALATVHPGGDR